MVPRRARAEKTPDSAAHGLSGAARSKGDDGRSGC
jgi:hypothetical protein